MRRALLAALVLAAVALAALLALPLLLADRLAEAAIARAEAQVQARITVAGASASVFESFPRLTLELSGLRVDNLAPFEGTTLLEVQRARARFDLLSALTSDTPELEDIELIAPRLTLRTDASGQANTDILPEADAAGPAEPASPWSFKLRRYAVVDGALDLDDAAAGLVVLIEGLDHEGKGDFTQSLVDLDTLTEIDALSLRSGGVELLRRARLRSSLALRYDQDTGAIELAENTLTLNALTASLTGRVAPDGEAWDMDLGLGELSGSFKELLSLVPAVWSDSFEGLGSTGSFRLSGAIKGRLDDARWPAFELALGVADGSFSDPALPSSVRGIDLDGALTHGGEGGLSGLVVDLRRFGLDVEGSRLTGRLKVSHLDADPFVDLDARGRLDLARLRAALPASEVAFGGLMDLDARLRGRVSDFTAQNVANVDADGHIKLAGFTWDDPAMGLPVGIPTLDLQLSPRSADVRALEMDLQAFGFSASGQLDNLVPWALTDAPLSGRMSLRSPKVDLDALPSSDEGEAEGSSSIVVVPAGYDLTFDADVDELIYGGQTFEDFRGRMIVRDGTLTFEDMQMTVLSGALGVEGSYAATSPEAALIDLRLSFGDPEVARAMERFEVLRRVAALFEGAQGRFNTSLRVQARLGPDLSPDLATLSVEGLLRTFNFSFAPRFGAGLVSSLGLSGERLRMDDARVRFKVDQGQLRLDPFSLVVGGVAATLSGRSGLLDEALDLTLDLRVPTARLAATPLAARLPGGASGEVPVRVRVGGTRADPKLSFDPGAVGEALVGGAVEAGVEGARAQATRAVDAAYEEALATARALGEGWVAEAERQAGRVREQSTAAADALRAEAKDKARKLRREAKGNPIAEAAADKAAQKLTDEAEAAARKLEREGDAKADALVREARGRSEAALREAEALRR